MDTVAEAIAHEIASEARVGMNAFNTAAITWHVTAGALGTA
jgi:hypothetical protein